MGTWTLVYATEPNEPNATPAIKVVAGTLKELRDAAVNAADVKVLYRPSASQWRAITCTDVLIKGSGGRTSVIARGSMVNAVNLPVGDGIGAESFAFDSGGFVAHSRFDPVTGRHGFGAFAAATMRWYVRDYEVPFWATVGDDLPPIIKRRGG